MKALEYILLKRKNVRILSVKEINELIVSGMLDAEQELKDNGQILTVECTSKNGDHVTTKEYGKRIDKDKYNKIDLARHDRLKVLTGVAS